jgi:transcriptional regulator with XRE-family HTH domain
VAAISQLRRVLGENIRLHRKRTSLSQEVLAEKADLHPKYVSEVERGGKTISVDSLGRIAKALRVSVRDLFEGL